MADIGELPEEKNLKDERWNPSTYSTYSKYSTYDGTHGRWNSSTYINILNAQRTHQHIHAGKKTLRGRNGKQPLPIYPWHCIRKSSKKKAKDMNDSMWISGWTCPSGKTVRGRGGRVGGGRVAGPLRSSTSENFAISTRSAKIEDR